MIFSIKNFIQNILVILMITKVNSSVPFEYQGQILNHELNIPLIPSVTPISWNPELKVLPLCIELNNNTIETSLISSAIDNVNRYLYSGNIDSTSLFLYNYIYTNEKCPSSDLVIKIIKSTSTAKSPGYCSRKFMNGTITRPHILYLGCDITINVCALQSTSIFYNVLLHELLHIIGLDHPPKKEDSVMSYTISSLDKNLTIIGQTKDYIQIRPKDVNDLNYIIRRDFPNSLLPNPSLIKDILPNVSPYMHVSGTDNYLLNDYMNVTQCWISKSNSPSTNGNSPSTNGNSPSTNGNSPSTNGNSPSTNGNSPSTNGNSPSTNGNSPNIVQPQNNKCNCKCKGKGKGKGKGRSKQNENLVNIQSNNIPTTPNNTNKNLLADDVKINDDAIINVDTNNNNNINIYSNEKPVININSKENNN